MNIREILIKLRDDNKLSQQEFADMLNVSRQTVFRWEAGKSVPSSVQISNICRVFGLDANELLSNSSAQSEGEPLSGEGRVKKPLNKYVAAAVIIAGVVLLLAVAGIIITIIYAVKDGMYDTGVTVWIMTIPSNTPMIILSVILAAFIVALIALLVYLIRRKGK